MRATVTSAFTDRETGEVHLPGGSYEGERARLEELAAKGLVEAPKPPRKPAGRSSGR